MIAAGTVMTADELGRYSAGHKFTELVRGRTVVREPPGLLHGVEAVRIATKLATYVDAHALGVVAADAGFHIATNPDTVRAPDVAFIRADRLSHIPQRGFGRVAPDLVVEIVSPNDRPRDVREKAADWLAAGVRLVWEVDPRRHTARVHRAGGSVTCLSPGDRLDGEDVVPGFHLDLT